MKGTVVIIYHNGRRERHEFDSVPTLEWLQHAVRRELPRNGEEWGYIELIPNWNIWIDDDGTPHGCIVWGDSNGKIVDPPLPPNITATNMWTGRFADFLVGNIVICFGDDEFMAGL